MTAEVDEVDLDDLPEPTIRPKKKVKRKIKRQDPPPDTEYMKESEVRDVRSRLTALGGDTFHFRIRKKPVDGGMPGYVGRLPADTADFEGIIGKRWGDGEYIIHAHWNDNRRIDQIRPINLRIGDPENPKAQVVSAAGRSNRVSSIEEEIEATRKEKELYRAKKELEKAKAEEEEKDMPVNPEIFAKVEALEEYVGELKRRNEELENERKEKTLLDHIARLEQKMTEMAKPRVDPEAERLRLQIEEMRNDRIRQENERHQREIEALKAEVEKRNKFGLMEVAQLAAPFAPILSDLVKSRQSASLQMIDTITKVGGLLKDSMPKGLDIEKIVTLAPLVTKLLPQQDYTGMFEVMATMITPLIEAAASGGGGGGGSDDMAGVIKQVLGAVQQAMAPRQQAGGVQQMPMFPAPPQAVQGPQGRPQRQPAPPPQGVAQQPPLAQPKQPPKKIPEAPRAGLPISLFANDVAMAISRRDEDFKKWVSQAERTLGDSDLNAIRKYRDGAMLASYLGGQPDVSTSALSTSYAKRWLSEFLKFFRMDEDGEEAPAKESRPTSGSLAEILGLAESPDPEPKILKSNIEKVETAKTEAPYDAEIMPGIRRPNTFDYPEDSVVKIVEGYESPLAPGPMDLPVEIPSPETLEKREKERLEAVEKYKNPPECDFKKHKPGKVEKRGRVVETTTP